MVDQICYLIEGMNYLDEGCFGTAGRTVQQQAPWRMQAELRVRLSVPKGPLHSRDQLLTNVNAFPSLLL